MRLTGVIDRSMNNFFCLRGFAPMLQLANVSESIPEIQRELISDHAGEMERFLSSSEFTFFPEVILCVDFQANTATPESISLLRSAINLKGNLSRAKVGKISVSISTYQRQSAEDRDIRTKDKVQSAFLDFDENAIKKFLRIDGNHRLSAVHEGSSYKDMPIPFCLLFFYGEHETDKFCRALFHNINTKQIPLRTEENLKVIIEGEDAFPDDILRGDASFGLPYIFTRKLCSVVKFEYYPEVNSFIGQSKYTYFVEVFTQLLSLELVLKDDSAVDILIKSITDINAALKESQITAITENIAVLGAMTVYKLQCESFKYKRFVSWVTKNNIGLAKNLHITDVISIFDSVYENIPKQVFLARWYPSSTHDQYTPAVRRLEAIRSIVEDDFNLKLVDMATQDGGTFDIREVMYNKIDSSDIFIADLTGARHNVMVEVGYALKNIGQKKMLFYFCPTSEYSVPPFDISGFRYEPISEAADMRDALCKHIEAILNSAELGEI
ncbi:MAG: hypothetical protein FWC92_10070 [Defluviitaleaceae bacterium]|nr:hypothetical protein [Defluviitaleaceae bacterium]